MQFRFQVAATLIIGVLSLFVLPTAPELSPIVFVVALAALVLENYASKRGEPAQPAAIEPLAVAPDVPDMPHPEVVDDGCLALFAALSEGNLAARHPEEGHAANAAMEQLQTAIEEVIALVELMAAGDLSTRANGTYAGDISSMGQSLNTVQDALIRMIRKAAGVAADVTEQSQEMRAGASDIEARVRRQTALMDDISASISSAQTRMREVEQKAAASGAKTDEIRGIVQAGVAATDTALGALTRMEADTREVGSILSLIEAIAQQTGLLAVNASIEAARAGEAGRGFAVVSEEVKELATRSQEAAHQIRGIVQSTGASVSGCAQHVTECADLMRNIAGEVDAAQVLATEIEADCREQSESLDHSHKSVHEMERHCTETTASAKQSASLAASLDTVAARLRNSLDGFRLQDDTMVEAVQAMARQVAGVFERAIARGDIEEDALFAKSYAPVSGIEPPQFTTPFTDFTDAVLPAILERVYDIGPHAAFAAAVNTDGFLPTHNRKFSQAPRPDDPVFNAGNARNRRFFKDRVGLAAGQSTAAVLIQSYRRDMGGGTFVTMKDISAPIHVNGRHWGGLRIGYLPTPAAAEDKAA